MSTLNTIKLYLKRDSYLPYSGWYIHVDLHGTSAYTNAPNTGSIISSATSVKIDDVSTSGGWATFVFSPAVTLSSTGFYGIHVWVDAPSDYAAGSLYYYYGDAWVDATGGGTTGTERGWIYYIGLSHWQAGSYYFAYQANCTGEADNTSGNATGSAIMWATGIGSSRGVGIRSYLTGVALPDKVTNPTPANGSGPAMDFSNNSAFSWDGAAGATSYNLACGKDINMVDFQVSGLTSIFYDLTDSDIANISPSDIVYWRVDSVGVNGTTTGDVWTFDPRPEKASDPVPSSSSTGITTDLDQLSWTLDASTNTTSTIYLMGSKVQEQDANILSIGSSSFGTLGHYSTTFTWSVDTSNVFGTTTGDEWTFTTLPFHYLIGSYTLFPGGSPPDYSTGDGVNTGGIPGVDFAWNSFNGVIPNINKLVAVAKNSFFFEDL